MISSKRLRSVAQSTAHHAVSGLCHLHPHLGQACKADDPDSNAITLLTAAPDTGDSNEPLILATGALQDKFKRILESEGGELNDLDSAIATFEFDQKCTPRLCTVTLTTVDNEQVSATVHAGGHSVIGCSAP